MYRVGNNGYVADVIVGTRKNGAAVLYDLVSIYEKEIAEVPVTMASDNNSQRRQETSAISSIPQKFEKSSDNAKYSLSDSDGNNLTKDQSEYFKDSMDRKKSIRPV